GYIPVIAPVGVGDRGEAYNINADLVASEVARAIKAEKLIFLTDTEGVKDAEGRLISSLNKERALTLISSGVIKGGMVPKVRSALKALELGVGKVHIVDGRVPHSILLEVFTEEGIGTEIVK
ncbi:MAG: acetylglutamate kinase, partial [Aquificaceae bacterium]|nr:acetylglutamate kinase [Aquificaceae bacterium]